MLPIESVSKYLKSNKSPSLNEIQSELESIGVRISWNTLDKMRQCDSDITVRSLKIGSGYVLGEYDAAIEEAKNKKGE